LHPDGIAPLRAHVDAALKRRGWLVHRNSDPAWRFGRWDDTRWTTFLGDILGSEPYRSLAAATEIIDVIRLLVGGEPELHVGDVCRLVSPGSVDLTTPPHQDAAYLKNAEGVWTAWLALGPCPQSLGPIALLPGSHLDGLRAHAPVATGDGVVGTDVPDDAPWRASDLAAGDVLFFSSLTVHRALPNLTPDQLRVSVDYRYRPRPRQS
jgi:ectoine hydroxylase-related dioxygenase (phytanoyl-CoA dioxygenase family)